MLLYQRGDSSAFEVLYQRHKNALFNYIYHSCQNASQVEDIAHDVWLSVIRRVESYQPTASFKTYLYRIAWHRLVDYWRKTSTINPEELSEEALKSSLSPEDKVSISQQIQLALKQLPQAQRTAFLLKEEGFSQLEISEITQSKVETVKSRLRYANKSLKNWLEVDR